MLGPAGFLLTAAVLTSVSVTCSTILGDMVPSLAGAGPQQNPHSLCFGWGQSRVGQGLEGSEGEE
jgi:hypothetical protein